LVAPWLAAAYFGVGIFWPLLFPLNGPRTALWQVPMATSLRASVIRNLKSIRNPPWRKVKHASHWSKAGFA
jgi:hypothetical protein